MAAHVDPAFGEHLKPEVFNVFSAWAEQENHSYRLERWLVNGRSQAPVAYTTETDREMRKARRLVVKVTTVPDGKAAASEYRRHKKAIKEGGDFAARHMSIPVNHSVNCPERQWITFQTVAGDDLESTEVLTVLLRRSLGVSHQSESNTAARVFCDSQTFAQACANVVAGVLGDWNGQPYQLDHDPWTVDGFLRRHIFDQMEPGGRLHSWAQRFQGTEMTLDGEPGPLPNPFAAAQGRYFSPELRIYPIVGKAHGDLHTDNALIKVRPEIDDTAYYLIDLSLYENAAPLTRDPTHMLLYIIARILTGEEPKYQQDALIELLLDTHHGPRDRVPGWLPQLIDHLERACDAWLQGSGLRPAWTEQRLLSIAGCAMLFLGRTSTPEPLKPWFLRLAGKALAHYASMHRDHVASASQTRAAAPHGADNDWIAWLCRDLPEFADAAHAAGHDDDAEGLKAAARSGLDRKDDYLSLVRKLGGPEPGDPRFGTKGAEGRSEPESFVCPLNLCPRRDQRAPGGPIPTCHLNREGKIRLRSVLDAGGA
ncbi:hypothetical protein [Solwaraspora sp. WMMA2065]|uniref:hypothetical protein n=1 Tax=Solwaraspora sp. WMMA2065 TaxID=3015166 RepID=UPI00259BADD5|nr:hypothetical protein [Solwaraspora sp. WMMA2065]WJK33086.1 hypothetical protein O7610_20500 [Solwaraspora sp. WMMA2065]